MLNNVKVSIAQKIDSERCVAKRKVNDTWWRLMCLCGCWLSKSNQLQIISNFEYSTLVLPFFVTVFVKTMLTLHTFLTRFDSLLF